MTPIDDSQLKLQRLSLIFTTLFVVTGLGSAVLISILMKSTHIDLSGSKAFGPAEVLFQFSGLVFLGAIASFLGVVLIQLELWSRWLKVGRGRGVERPSFSPVFMIAVLTIAAIMAWPIAEVDIRIDFPAPQSPANPKLR